VYPKKIGKRLSKPGPLENLRRIPSLLFQIQLINCLDYSSLSFFDGVYLLSPPLMEFLVVPSAILSL
jgi:hypothetical protein